MRIGRHRAITGDDWPWANPERAKSPPRFGGTAMAREHHCPNDGPQPCNASTSKIHTCGLCAAIWEEDLSAPTPAPAAVRPTTAATAAPVPPAPAKPAVTVPTTAAAPKPPVLAATAPATSAPRAAAVPQATPSAAPPAAVGPKPAAPASAPPTPAPQAPTFVATGTPAAPPGSSPAAAAKALKTLSDVVQAAKVKRCPKCVSDGLAAPLDYFEVNGRVVLQDSQTYRGHRWFADTGELYTAPSVPAAAPAPSPVRPASPAPPSA